MNEKEKLHNELEEIYEKIVEMLSNGNFLQLNGKAINLTELNEYINAQQEEIERLTAESTKWESKFYDEAKKVDKAIEYLESYNTDFKNCRFGEAPISLRELGDLLDILKGSDKE